VVKGNFQVPHYRKISSSLQLGAKEKANLENFTFFLVQGKLYHQGQDQVLRRCFED
jgi:hypothetical protein